MKKYLPIGTIIKLKNNNRLIMIIGYTTSMKLKKFLKYDYFGCFYPIGVINLQKTIVFQHDDIEKVFFIGYNSKKLKSINIITDFIEREEKNG